MRPFIALALAAALAGCAVSRAAQVPVSKELAADCASQCAVLDMRLAAVVIVANAGGCVCEPRSAPSSGSSRAGAAAAAGGAVVAAAAAAAAAQQAQHQTGSIPSIPSIR